MSGLKKFSPIEVRARWFTIGLALSLSAATFAKPMNVNMDKPWGAAQNPANIGLSMNYGYGMDPTRSASSEAWAKKTPWTGAWWWTQSGSIATRWRTKLYWNADRTAKQWPTAAESDALTYKVYSAAELSNMSEDQIRENLSAVEKLDVVSGHADPRASGYYQNLASVRNFVAQTLKNYPDELNYHGLCHGFSYASIYLPEPKAVTIRVKYTLPDGRQVIIPVGFGSGDLKALGTYFYGQKTADHEDLYKMIGGSGEPLNAGTFHVLLTNIVGNRGESFVIDTAVGKSVWNYPVAGYKISLNRSTGIISPNVDPRADKEVYVAADVYYMGTTNPTELPWGPNANKRLMRKHYEYRIEMTSDNQIVGGTWMPSSDRPDFAWKPKGAIPFDGDYKVLTPYWIDAASN